MSLDRNYADIKELKGDVKDIRADIKDNKDSQTTVNQDVAKALSELGNVVKNLASTLESVDKSLTSFGSFRGYVTKGFYIACGVVLVATGSLSDVTKIAIKFIGG